MAHRLTFTVSSLIKIFGIASVSSLCSFFNTCLLFSGVLLSLYISIIYVIWTMVGVYYIEIFVINKCYILQKWVANMIHSLKFYKIFVFINGKYKGYERKKKLWKLMFSQYKNYAKDVTGKQIVILKHQTTFRLAHLVKYKSKTVMGIKYNIRKDHWGAFNSIQMLYWVHTTTKYQSKHFHYKLSPHCVAISLQHEVCRLGTGEQKQNSDVNT